MNDPEYNATVEQYFGRSEADRVEDAIAERDRYKAALEQLRTYPLLTRHYGPLEQGAQRIIREALR